MINVQYCESVHRSSFGDLSSQARALLDDVELFVGQVLLVREIDALERVSPDLVLQLLASG